MGMQGSPVANTRLTTMVVAAIKSSLIVLLFPVKISWASYPNTVIRYANSVRSFPNAVGAVEEVGADVGLPVGVLDGEEVGVDVEGVSVGEDVGVFVGWDVVGGDVGVEVGRMDGRDEAMEDG